ncbi:dTDP-4-dehydrorhamnose 3,5-epimerase [Candidatus Woesearchaeota archaeon]|nr:dTDP-4-dehydrorhamnose 3,5-epimerase [Candidatus Woesearchaeota archaeon]
MPFEFERQSIPEVILIRPKVFGDQRGFFMETWKKSDFEKNGIDIEFTQDNHSKSSKNVIRGLHYQKDPNSQGKIVRVVKGRLLDVAVDIRKGSPTYGKHVAIELTEENKCMLWVPPGFAHGICVLEDDTELLYKATGEYAPADDRQILWNDPDIGIDWPIMDPTLSEKDAKAPRLKDADINFTYEGDDKE